MADNYTEQVAKAICFAAATSVVAGNCAICDKGKCTMWRQFCNEADAAIAVVRTLDMHAQARSIIYNK